MKGFKDSSNKFHPITDYKKGTRKSRDQKAKTEGVKIRKQRELLNEIPDDYNWETHGDHPQQFTDEAYTKFRAKHREISGKLGSEINEELPAIIQSVENLKSFHESAIDDADDLIRSLENKGHDGYPLPLEYMDLSNTEIDNFIRDWSNVGHSGEEFSHNQNESMVRDLAELRNFQNKLEQYHESHGHVS